MQWAHDFLEEHHPLSCLRIFYHVFFFLTEKNLSLWWFMSLWIVFWMVALVFLLWVCPFSFFLLEFDLPCVFVSVVSEDEFLGLSHHCMTKSLLIVTVGFEIHTTCGCSILSSFFFIISVGATDWASKFFVFKEHLVCVCAVFLFFFSILQLLCMCVFSPPLLGFFFGFCCVWFVWECLLRRSDLLMGALQRCTVLILWVCLLSRSSAYFMTVWGD